MKRKKRKGLTISGTQNTLVVNVDASPVYYKDCDNQQRILGSGTGAIIKDINMNVLQTAGEYVNRFLENSTQAEYIAIINGIERTKDMDCDKVIILSDSQGPIYAINNPVESITYANARAEEIYIIKALIEMSRHPVEFYWIPRERNKEADSMARLMVEMRLQQSSITLS